MKCQFGQCRRPIYHGMSAMCDIYPRTNNNDREILFVRLGWYCNCTVLSVHLEMLKELVC